MALPLPVLLSDAGTGVVVGAIGLAMTCGAVVGIVGLAKRSSGQSAGGSVLVVLGVLALAGFGLVGLLLTGCGAMLVK